VKCQRVNVQCKKKQSEVIKTVFIVMLIDHWIHAICANLAASEFLFICNEDDTNLGAIHNALLIVFPFQTCSDSEFNALFDKKQSIHLDLTVLKQLFNEDESENNRNDFNYYNSSGELNNDSYNIIQSCTYVSSAKAHTIMENMNNCSLIIVHINIRSLAANFTKLQTFISFLKIKPYIISINETWLYDNRQGDFNSLFAYTFVSNC